MKSPHELNSSCNNSISVSQNLDESSELASVHSCQKQSAARVKINPVRCSFMSKGEDLRNRKSTCSNNLGKSNEAAGKPSNAGKVSSLTVIDDEIFQHKWQKPTGRNQSVAQSIANPTSVVRGGNAESLSPQAAQSVIDVFVYAPNIKNKKRPTIFFPQYEMCDDIQHANQKKMFEAIPGIIENMKARLIDQQHFRTVLHNFNYDNYDQFFFYVKKMFEYISVRQQKIYNEIMVFKLNRVIINHIKEHFLIAVRELGTEKVQVDQFLKQFEELRHQFVASSLLEEIGGFNNLRKVVLNLFSYFQNIPAIQKRISGHPDRNALIQQVNDGFGDLLKGRVQLVQDLIVKWRKNDPFKITSKEFFCVKLGIAQTISQMEGLDPSILELVIEKVEHLRTFTLSDHLYDKIIHNHRLRDLLVSQFKHQDVGLRQEKIEYFVGSLLYFLIGETTVKEMREQIEALVSQKSMIQSFLVTATSHLQTALESSQLIPMMSKRLYECFYVLRQNFGFDYNIQQIVHSKEQFLETMQTYFKNRYKDRMLPKKVRINEVFELGWLKVFFQLFSCEFYNFMYDDMQQLFWKSNKPTDQHFKVWFLGFKHSLMLIYSITKPEAKKITAQLADYFKYCFW